MIGIIYKVTSPSGKVYIGKTTRGIEARKAQHLACSFRGSTFLFSKAIRKYGELLVWELIDTAETSEELSLLEISWIKYYHSFSNGYNLTMGGEGARKYATVEESKEIAKAQMKAYRKTPEAIAVKRVYAQSLGAKAKRIARREKPGGREREKAYNQTPQIKAARRAYQNTPEAKAKAKARKQNPVARAKQNTWAKKYRKTPWAKAKRRALGLKAKISKNNDRP